VIRKRAKRAINVSRRCLLEAARHIARLAQIFHGAKSACSE
jgi:hypothetical protein